MLYDHWGNTKGNTKVSKKYTMAISRIWCFLYINLELFSTKAWFNSIIIAHLLYKKSCEKLN